MRNIMQPDNKKQHKERGATHTEHTVSCWLVSSNEAWRTFAQRPWWRSISILPSRRPISQYLL
jgi:hypothetical protein